MIHGTWWCGGVGQLISKDSSVYTWYQKTVVSDDTWWCGSTTYQKTVVSDDTWWCGSTTYQKTVVSDGTWWCGSTTYQVVSDGTWWCGSTTYQDSSVRYGGVGQLHIKTVVSDDTKDSSVRCGVGLELWCGS